MRNLLLQMILRFHLWRYLLFDLFLKVVVFALSVLQVVVFLLVVYDKHWDRIAMRIQGDLDQEPLASNAVSSASVSRRHRTVVHAVTLFFLHQPHRGLVLKQPKPPNINDREKNSLSSHYILGYPDNPVSIRLLNYSIGSQNRYFRSPLLPLLDLSIARLQLTARAEVYLPIPRTLQVDLRYLISTLGSVSLLSVWSSSTSMMSHPQPPMTPYFTRMAPINPPSVKPCVQFYRVPAPPSPRART
ncbi:hypothetical protein B0H13DRAFT_447456 [Mycena leptocephala]|nr:hypothetical protein B0H13DRAFT_447456 [Mycena leptocephala]